MINYRHCPIFVSTLVIFVMFQTNKKIENVRVKRSLEISGGSRVPKNEFPFMARIEIWPVSSREPVGVCGGSLITNKYVITAKHCLYSYNNTNDTWDNNFNDMCTGWCTNRTHNCWVILKNIDTEKRDGKVIRIKSVHFPPGTSAKLVAKDDKYETEGSDIALIELEEMVDYHSDPDLEPVQLYTENDPPDGTMLTTLGWGYTGPEKENLQVSTFLKTARLRLNNGGLGHEPNIGNYLFTDVHMNDKGQYVAPCRGDSGGPLLINADRKWYVLATLHGDGYDCVGDRVSGRFQGREVWNKVIHHNHHNTPWPLSLMKEAWFPVGGYLYKVPTLNGSYHGAEAQCVDEGGQLASLENFVNKAYRIYISRDLRLTNRENDNFWLQGTAPKNTRQCKAKHGNGKCVTLMRRKENEHLTLCRQDCNEIAFPLCQKEKQPNSWNITESSPIESTIEIPGGINVTNGVDIKIDIEEYDDYEYNFDDYDNATETEQEIPALITNVSLVHPNAHCTNGETWQIEASCTIKSICTWSQTTERINVSLSTTSNWTVNVRITIEERTQKCSDIVLLTGGWPNETSVEIFGQSECTPYLNLPEERHGHTSHYLDGQILICGGYYTQTSCLQLHNGEFKHHSQLQRKRYYHSGVILGGKLSVMGGSLSSTTIERLMGTNWTLSNEIGHLMEGSCVVALENMQALIIGGRKNKELSTMYYGEGNWTRVRNLPRRRYGHSCVILEEDRVLVAGGYDGRNLDTSVIYDIGSKTWTDTHGKINTARRWGQLVNLEGRILYFGGRDSNDKGLDTIEEFHRDNETWTVHPKKMKIPGWGLSALVVPASAVGCHP